MWLNSTLVFGGSLKGIMGNLGECGWRRASIARGDAAIAAVRAQRAARS